MGCDLHPRGPPVFPQIPPTNVCSPRVWDVLPGLLLTLPPTHAVDVFLVEKAKLGEGQPSWRATWAAVGGSRAGAAQVSSPTASLAWAPGPGSQPRASAGGAHTHGAGMLRAGAAGRGGSAANPTRSSGPSVEPGGRRAGAGAGDRVRASSHPQGPKSRAPTCQPSFPDVFPQQIPGSGRGVPQLLADGPPELRLERFPRAGHFRSVFITPGGLATATRSWPAVRPPATGDARRRAPAAVAGPAAGRTWVCRLALGRDALPPERLRLFCAPSTPVLPHFPSSRPALLAPSLPPAPLRDCLAPHSFPASCLPPARPPVPKPHSLVLRTPDGASTPFSISCRDQGLCPIPATS